MAEQHKTDQEQYGTTKLNISTTYVLNLIDQEHVDTRSGTKSRTWVVNLSHQQHHSTTNPNASSAREEPAHL
jgi:hypothetical protein